MAVKIDEDNLKQGLLGLVIALVEIIEEVLERQALKRMESGRLTEDEIDRLGKALMETQKALEKIKSENGIEDVVKSVRNDLNNVVDNVVNLERWEEPLKGV